MGQAGPCRPRQRETWRGCAALVVGVSGQVLVWVVRRPDPSPTLFSPHHHFVFGVFEPSTSRHRHQTSTG